MPGFVFRLESVLRVRLHAEQHEQRRVAEAQIKLRNLQDQLEVLQSRIAESSRDLRQHIGSGNLDPRWLLQHAQYAQTLRAQAAAISDEVFHAGLALQTAQEQLVIASAQRKSLEKLRDRQQDHFQVEQHKHERNHHDEVAARHVRRER